ncbi:Uncharacterised protein [uncultured archaeon]|nr:Uncharacterised protein [uncultured archaeon]
MVSMVTLATVAKDAYVINTFGAADSRSPLSSVLSSSLAPTSALTEPLRFATTAAFTAGAITKVVAFWLKTADTVGEKSIRTPVDELIFVFPVTAAVTMRFGTMTLYAVPFMVIFAEVTLNLIRFIVAPEVRLALPITMLELTMERRSTVPLPVAEVHPEPASPLVWTATEE